MRCDAPPPQTRQRIGLPLRYCALQLCWEPHRQNPRYGVEHESGGRLNAKDEHLTGRFGVQYSTVGVFYLAPQQNTAADPVD